MHGEGVGCPLISSYLILYYTNLPPEVWSFLHALILIYHDFLCLLGTGLNKLHELSTNEFYVIAQNKLSS